MDKKELLGALNRMTKTKIPTIAQLMDELRPVSHWEIGEPGEGHQGMTVVHPIYGLTAVWHFRTQTNELPAPRIMIYRTRTVGGSAWEYLDGDIAPVADVHTRQGEKNRVPFGPVSFKRAFARWIKEQIRDDWRTTVNWS